MDLMATFSNRRVRRFFSRLFHRVAGAGCPVVSLAIRNSLCLSSTVTDLSAFEEDQERVCNSSDGASILASQTMVPSVTEHERA